MAATVHHTGFALAAAHPSFSFQVHGKPAAQGSKRHLGRGVMVESSKRLPGWRNDVTFAALQARPPGWPVTGAMAVEVLFTFQRPQAHHISSDRSRPLKPTAPQFHTTIAGDLDKLARALCDAITASGSWLDDAQVVDLRCRRGFAPPGEPEGATVTITALEHQQ